MFYWAPLCLRALLKKRTKIIFHHKNVLSTPGFSGIITTNKQINKSICKFLHFANNESINSFQEPKKLFRIFPIISCLNNKFQILCLPNQDILIDESLTLWKGHLSFKRYLPLRPSKFGIKIYELCDDTTKYLWSCPVYAS
jgi:hypothetical protein